MPKRWSLLAALPLIAALGPAEAQDGAALLEQTCGGCHAPTDGGLERIKDQRKTPEGWEMTIVRMIQLQDVELSDDERRALVKHLADTQGLAPGETEGHRYILEREPAAFEEPPNEQLAQVCARCHSYARVALQRRTEAEWRKLAHFHLGQYPSTEYQALGRDRNWWEIASEELPPELAGLYPLETEAWAAWQEQEAPDLSGSWRFVGTDPGRGAFEGRSEIAAGDGPDSYTYTAEIRYADGRTEQAEGRGILYTGHEWRGSATLSSGDEIREVYQVADDGRSASGRWFLANSDSLGGRFEAVRDDGSTILAVQPSHLRVGESAEIAVHGTGFDGEVDLGADVTIEEVVSTNADTVVVRATTGPNVATGERQVGVGETVADGLFTVYDRIDRLTVEPGYNIARVGGDGPIPRVPAQFEAVAWLDGPDGQAGTEDDVEIGRMPARWAVENFDEVAQEMDDAAFAGEIDASGLFMPAVAGLNPERPFDTNNAGNLKVIATIQDGDQTLTGEGQLLVTVQRWNDPPIR